MTMMIVQHAGAFAENKDIARALRLEKIIPALDHHESVVLDFSDVDAATQSFIHALISDVLRQYGSDILEHIMFKSCNPTVRKIIEIVIEYTQEGMSD